MKIVTVEQMRALEAAAQGQGISVEALMERAGLAVAREVQRLLESPRGSRCLVLVGSGNNGGDGLVAARHLHQWGARIQVYLCAPRQAPDPQLAMTDERGIPIASVQEDRGRGQLRGYLAAASVVIDAILGTGRTRPIQGPLRDVLGAVEEARRERTLPLVAVDLPTGLDADTGTVDPLCPRADITVALGYPKMGHFTFPGTTWTGRLQIADIGLPPALDRQIPLELMTPNLVRPLLPQRPLEAHKGTFGRLLVVAGSRHYVGAASLAGAGAYRAGAGLVTLASPAGVYPIAAGRLMEATHLPLPETEAGALVPEGVTQVASAAESCDALVVGCGLSQSPGVSQFVESLLLGAGDVGVPTVLDADALNALPGFPRWWERLLSPTVLTPHPGEMARLTELPASHIQERRLDVALRFAAHWRQVVVLKGAFTVVASPEGTARISPFANPGLASAGTGDVLAGVIGGLLAQGVSPWDAATCGVYVHGAAAEEVRNQLGDTGMMAGDLLPEIPRRIQHLKMSGAGRALNPHQGVP